METYQFGLVASTLLCSLVAGFLFAFACVAMPGLGKLDDAEFIRAFQVIDRVIQNNHPIFMLVWVGSILALVATGIMGFGQLQGTDRLLMAGALVLYLFGVQLPTLTINVPLNNALQTVDVQTADNGALAEARRRFEPRWNRWNLIRTILATVTSLLLIVLVLRL